MTPSRIRYARLGYAALQVTDLAASLHFYISLMGLQLASSTTTQAWLRCSDKPHDLILEQGEIAGLARVGFELESADELGKAFAHVSALGLKPAWSPSELTAENQADAAFRFRNPTTGLELDFYVRQTVAASPYEAKVAKIARLGHVVLNVKSYTDAQRFWVEQLGFVVSDHVPGRIAFLRCFPNRLHHSFALLAGERDGLNHINFMVSDLDDIGRAMNRMKKANVPIVFGPGRHLPSGSIFLYFLDPDGMTAEYSFGMEEINERGGREARALEARPEVLDTWGSIPDPRFGKTGVIVNKAYA
jgi:2,3-dihydroxy-p-cumate/2,3-dihydroxybenzoate 3,4-dioxygenase